MTRTKRRLRRGSDWHAWAWRHEPTDEADDLPEGFMHFAQPEKPKGIPPTDSGRWRRVKFVPVE